MSTLFVNTSDPAASDPSHDLFARCKAVCVPLMAKTELQSSSTNEVVSLLDTLARELREVGPSAKPLKPSLVSYIFLPVSTILRRNALGVIPDRVLEGVLNVLGLLAESWWYNADAQTWEQLFTFVALVIAGMDVKGKGRGLDEHCQLAAAQALYAILGGQAIAEGESDEEHSTRLALFRPKALGSMVGRTLNVLLGLCDSANTDLQQAALRAALLLIRDFMEVDLAPSVMPGVVSVMVRCALGEDSKKGWANGESVAIALNVIAVTVTNAIGDTVCVEAGAIRRVNNLEDLVELASEVVQANDEQAQPNITRRTASWLRGTATQLHIALNSLTPLLAHNNAIALRALISLALQLSLHTKLTLPQSQPLLLSFVLALSQSEYESVSLQARSALLKIASTPTSLQHILELVQDALSSVPRHIRSQSDTKLSHRLRQIRSVCSLAPNLPPVSAGIAKLLGAHGGIEKWGISLLSTLNFLSPSERIGMVPDAVGLLQGSSDGERPFPHLPLQNPADKAVQELLEDTLRDLGRAGGVECLYSIEWLVGLGVAERSTRGTAGLWCGALIAQGLADSPKLSRGSLSKVAKTARWMAKAVAELWQTREGDDSPTAPASDTAINDDRSRIEFSSGLITVDTSAIFPTPISAESNGSALWSPTLQKVAALRVIASASSVLQTTFAPVLMHALYPMLHSLVSSSSSLILHETASATLDYVARSAGYATPRNMLMANFDYALSGSASRLLRSKLDIEAARVLKLLVRLVGADVVEQMGDVVAECFERLDEYHGYEILVERLVEVLAEVIQVVKEDAEAQHQEENDQPATQEPDGMNDIVQEATVNNLLRWLKSRHDKPMNDSIQLDDEHLPREAWGDQREDIAEGHHHEHTDDERAPPPPPKSPEQPEPTSTDKLVHLIVSRSIPFLTHSSSLIRARILGLMASATRFLGFGSNVKVSIGDVFHDNPGVRLLLPQIHRCWPFVLNRLGDSEPFVVAAAATFVAALAEGRGSGDFVKQRLWDDVWPRFKNMLDSLQRVERDSALTQRRAGVGLTMDSMAIYATSTKLHIAMLRTLAATVRIKSLGGTPDKEAWDVAHGFLRFLDAREEATVQAAACRLFVHLKQQNSDAIWLVLSSAVGHGIGGSHRPAEQLGLSSALRRPFDIEQNAVFILSS
ncbi:hypothetical protein BKA62DRAFT_659463, partial [Auriculariales sp. MPI-PUGE-AT-0066]